MKKFFTSIILLAATAAFFLIIGWMQLWVPAGEAGVMISKTGGIHEKTITGGDFMWRWERLFPTNVKIRSFKLNPVSDSVTVNGKLPSAELYSAMLEGKPDFSWNISLSVSITLKSEKLPDFIRKTDAKTQEDIEFYLHKQLQAVGQTAAKMLIEREKSEQNSVFGIHAHQNEVIQQISSSRIFQDIEILSLDIISSSIPDTALYETARQAYNAYREKVTAQLDDVVRAQAGEAAQDYLQIERFARWGKILQDYPILIDFLAVSRNDMTDAVDVLNKMGSRKK